MTVNELLEELQDIANAGGGEYIVVYETETGIVEVQEVLEDDESSRVKLVTHA